MNKTEIESVFDVVKSCDATVLVSFGEDGYPDARDVTNIMNKNNRTTDLYFMTGRGTPKYKQLSQNPKCCLYYFNPSTRYSVRLYGEMHFITDKNIRQQHWSDDYRAYGYGGAGDSEFILMKFVPHAYKYYIGSEQKQGTF